MRTDLAPVVLFCYNRPEHTLRTLEALSGNTYASDTELFVYCDGPKAGADDVQLEKTGEVRRIVKSRNWCGKVNVIERDSNWGLSASVISGVTEVVTRAGKVIVLEDDLVTSAYFLEYMNNALARYENEKQVYQVSAYMFPVDFGERTGSAFFLPMTTSWGWATWKRAWDRFDAQATGFEELHSNGKKRLAFDLDGAYPYSKMLFAQMEEKTIDSWAIRWWWTVFTAQGLTLFPSITLTANTGFGKEATHTSEDTFRAGQLNSRAQISLFPATPVSDEQAFTEVKNFLRWSRTGQSNGANGNTSSVFERAVRFIQRRFTSGKTTS